MLVLSIYDGGDDRDKNNNYNNISCTKVATIVHREVSRGCLVPAPMQGVLLLQNLHHLASRCVCVREREWPFVCVNVGVCRMSVWGLRLGLGVSALCT